MLDNKSINSEIYIHLMHYFIVIKVLLFNFHFLKPIVAHATQALLFTMNLEHQGIFIRFFKRTKYSNNYRLSRVNTHTIVNFLSTSVLIPVQVNMLSPVQ